MADKIQELTNSLDHFFQWIDRILYAPLPKYTEVEFELIPDCCLVSGLQQTNRLEQRLLDWTAVELKKTSVEKENQALKKTKS